MDLICFVSICQNVVQARNLCHKPRYLTFKQIWLNTSNVKLQVTSVTVLVFNVTCHQTTDTKNLSGWMPQKSLQNCSALMLRILLPLSHSSLSYKTTAWWTIPQKSTAFPHFPFLLSTIHFHIFWLIAIFIGIPSGSLCTQRREIFHCRVSLVKVNYLEREGTGQGTIQHAYFSVVWLPNQGHPTSIFGKYLFGRWFKIYSFRNICCKLSCLPASPRIFAHLKNGIIAHF